MSRELSANERASLRAIYTMILSSPDLLIDAAAKRDLTIREAYISLVDELKAVSEP
jgi:hypothetical protein